MTSCNFPQHHGKGARGGGLGLVLLIVTALVVWKARALILEVLTIAGITVAVLVAAAVVALVARAAVRHHRGVQASATDLKRRRSLRWVRHLPRAVWAICTWRWVARNLQLAAPDKHRAGRIRRPRALIWPHRHGVSMRIKTTPGTGRVELEAVAQHLADHLRVARVSVTQPRPGRIRVRALVHDPLLEPLRLEDVPAGIYTGQDLTRAYVGRDEHGAHRWMQVKDNTAATVAGQPGSGKSVGINGLLLQWAPSPACQFGTADGKSPVDGGDYEVWRPRAWRTCSDSREDTADMLSDACKVMRERLGRVAELTGSRNAWHRGPTEFFPLFGLVLDEAQRYLDATVVKRDKDLERLILQIQQMAGDIVRQGRSVLMFLILATQKATTDSMPSQIRDNAALSLALAQKTDDAAVAALGSQIRNYPSFSPTTLQGPEYTGVAVATMRTGQDPFTRIKLPGVTHADLAAAAAATAHLRRDPALLFPSVPVPDDASALV
jgi:DNA segregation ATPase FtsK/SpoIIIE, S-DNA-T family